MLTEEQTDVADKPLSLQRQEFVDHLCTDAEWNGAEAARKAKYSEKAAKEQASYLLTLPNIQRAIEKKKAELYSGEAAKEEEVRRNHRLAQTLALAKGDLTTFTRNNEDLGKTLTMYSDRVVSDTTEEPDALSPDDLVTLRTLARAITDKGLSGPVLSAREFKAHDGARRLRC